MSGVPISRPAATLMDCQQTIDRIIGFNQDIRNNLEQAVSSMAGQSDEADAPVNPASPTDGTLESMRESLGQLEALSDRINYQYGRLEKALHGDEKTRAG